MNKNGMTSREAKIWYEWLQKQSSDTLIKLCVIMFKLAAEKIKEE